jgi:hypothetical protein
VLRNLIKIFVDSRRKFVRVCAIFYLIFRVPRRELADNEKSGEFVVRTKCLYDDYLCIVTTSTLYLNTVN